MKNTKTLLSGACAAALAAVAIAGFAPAAQAAEFEMKVDGYFEALAGYGSVEYENLSGEDANPDFDGFDVKRDAEIHFRPLLTLDNGIRVGATVELEGASDEDQIDEAYLSIRGAFGRVVLGSEDSARTTMQFGAPDLTLVRANDRERGRVGDFIPFLKSVGVAGGQAEPPPSSTTVGEPVVTTTGPTTLTQTPDGTEVDSTYLYEEVDVTLEFALGEGETTEFPTTLVRPVSTRHGCDVFPTDDSGNAFGRDNCIQNGPAQVTTGTLPDQVSTQMEPVAVANTGRNYIHDTDGSLGSTWFENASANDNAERLAYFTPRVGGLQAGVSYARDGGEDSNAQADISDEALANIVDIGMNWVHTVGGVDMVLSGGWGRAFGDAEDNPEVWNMGLNLGHGGWTLGGSFAEQNNAGNRDGTAFDAGISYESGPWGVSFTWFRGENADNEYGNNYASNFTVTTTTTTERTTETTTVRVGDRPVLDENGAEAVFWQVENGEADVNGGNDFDFATREDAQEFVDEDFLGQGVNVGDFIGQVRPDTANVEQTVETTSTTTTVVDVESGGDAVSQSGQFGNDETLDIFTVGVSYTPAEGVLLNLYGAYAAFEEDTGDAGGKGDNFDGFTVGTGLQLRF